MFAKTKLYCYFILIYLYTQYNDYLYDQVVITQKRKPVPIHTVFYSLKFLSFHIVIVFKYVHILLYCLGLAFANITKSL